MSVQILFFEETGRRMRQTVKLTLASKARTTCGHERKLLLALYFYVKNMLFGFFFHKQRSDEVGKSKT